MMSEGLIVRIGSDTKSFSGGIDSAKRDLKGLSDVAEKEGAKLSSKFGGMGKSIGTAFAAAAVATGAALAAMIAKTLDTVGAMDDLSKQLNTTYASMVTITHAAKLAGVEQGQLSASARMLELNLSKATDASSAQAEAFAKLGLNAKELQAIPLDERIAKINTALTDNVAASERAAVAAEIYGAKNAAAMALIDADGIREAAEQTKAFGLALSQVDAAKIAAAGDSIDTMKAGLGGLATQITLAVSPAIQAMGQMFVNAAKNAGGFGQVGKQVGDVLIRGMSVLFGTIDKVVNEYRAVRNVLQGVWQYAVNFVNAIRAKFETLDRLIRGFQAAYNMIKNGITSAMGAADAAIKNTAGNVSNLQGEFDKLTAQNKNMTIDVTPKLAPMPSIPSIASTAGGGSIKTPKDTSAADNAKAQADAEKKAIEQKLEAYRQSLMTETELAKKKYDEDVRMFADAERVKKITKEQFDAMSIERTTAYNEQIATLKQEAWDSEFQKLNEQTGQELALQQWASNEANRIDEEEKRKKLEREQALHDQVQTIAVAAMEFSKGRSKSMFEIGKKAAIADTLISTYTGATRIVRDGGLWALPAAAAFTAQGLANVQKIKAQQFGGGSSGGGSTAIKSSSGGSASSGGGGGNESIQKVANVSIHAQGDVMRSLARGLIEPLRDLQRDGYMIGGVQLA